jgi:predicted acyltransferase
MAKATTSGRLVSLDQYRGYTVLGMFFVNFVSGFSVIPLVFKHPNTYCTYHDTIMPQFFFAVGLSYRLTLLRRLQSGKRFEAYSHVVRRNLGLILLGLVLYHIGGSVQSWAELRALTWQELAIRVVKRDLFQTLVHIGVTSLWVMPVIAGSAQVRIAFACFSGLLHVVLSACFYYVWVNAGPPGIDGGSLGFLTWAIPLLVGSLAYDAVVSDRGLGAVKKALLGGGAALMVLGYGLSCLVSPPSLRPGSPSEIGVRFAPLPFIAPLERKQALFAVDTCSAIAQAQCGSAAYVLCVSEAVCLADREDNEPLVSPDLWTMSQRAGSLSYLTFASGFALALYGVFYLLSDIGGWRVGIFRTLGSNALAGYILHDLVGDAFKPYAPSDSPLWYALGITGVYLLVCYVFLRHLEKQKLFLKL